MARQYATKPHFVDVANTRENAADLRRSLERIRRYRERHPLPETPRDTTVSDLMRDVTASLDGELRDRWIAYCRMLAALPIGRPN